MEDDSIAGNEPLADGMHIAVRVRRDFTVTDAGRLLAAARAAYVQVNPGATADEAQAVVTSAADDAVFVSLESSGLLGAPPTVYWPRMPAMGWSRAAGGRR